jgi:hypothetical protein
MVEVDDRLLGEALAGKIYALSRTYCRGKISIPPWNLCESQLNVERYPFCVSSPRAHNIHSRSDQTGMNHHMSSLCMLICESEGTVSISMICERVCDMLNHGSRPEDVIDDKT